MLRERIDAAVAAIREHTAVEPEIAITLGSGLGPLADHMDGVEIPYSDIPGFPVSTAPGHSGTLLVGNLFGKSCVAMKGRVHMYEGYTAQEVVFPLQVMASLGAETVILTNAAGGIRSDLKVGDLVAIEDHFSLSMATGADPLRGENDPSVGERFVSLNKAYDPDLLSLAQSLDSAIKRGVYAHNVGPTFEPPHLIHFFKQVGCDLVGMSTVPEVIAARHMGLKVFALSAVTNIAVSDIADSHITNEEEVWESVKIIEPKLLALMQAFIPALPTVDA